MHIETQKQFACCPCYYLPYLNKEPQNSSSHVNMLLHTLWLTGKAQVLAITITKVWKQYILPYGVMCTEGSFLPLVQDKAFCLSIFLPNRRLL